MKPREFCIGYDANGLQHFCPNKTSGWLRTGRKNPLWCENCDARRIARLDAQFRALEQTREANAGLSRIEQLRDKA